MLSGYPPLFHLSAASLGFFSGKGAFVVINDSETLPVNLLTIRFDGNQHHIEDVYRSFSFKTNLNHFRLCHVLGIFFYAVFALVDLQVAPENASIFMTIRFGTVCPLFCVGILLTYLPWYQYIYNYELGFYVLLTAAGYICMSFFAPTAFHFVYFLGFLACLVFGYTFLRLPFLFASAIGWIACAAYCFVQFNYGQLSQTALHAYTAYLIGFELLLMTICYTAERTNRKIFYLFHLLSIEREKITGMNDQLTDVVDKRTAELRQLSHAMKKVKKLSGLLPICASCKKIRDDTGYWKQIESYIRDRSEVEFSHGICPDCRQKWYPELYMENDDPLQS